MKVLSKNRIKQELAGCVRWLDILPRKENGIADAAFLLGKSPRTIEAYLSKSNDRVISADDLMTLGTEVARRIGQFPRDLHAAYTVYDASGNVTDTVNGVVTAAYLSDLQGGSYALDAHKWVHSTELKEDQQRKSVLRRMLSSGSLTKEDACEALDCDEYMLVMYQSHFPFLVSAVINSEQMRWLYMSVTSESSYAA